jgi:spore coat protein U domain-containing protein, fimbrial subunit CupE1/2/3/6
MTGPWRVATRRAACGSAVLFALLAASPHRADAACTVSVSSGVTFGAYNVFDSAPLDSTGQISYRCTPRGSHPAVQITITRGSSPTWTSRQLTKGSDILQYNIFRDMARTQVWGDGTSGTSAYVGTYPGSGQVSISLYGRIPPLQDAAVGTYGDTVTVVINF